MMFIFVTNVDTQSRNFTIQLNSFSVDLIRNALISKKYLQQKLFTLFDDIYIIGSNKKNKKNKNVRNCAIRLL